MKFASPAERTRLAAAFWCSLPVLLTVLAAGCAKSSSATSSSKQETCTEQLTRDCVCADGEAPSALGCESQHLSGLRAADGGAATDLDAEAAGSLHGGDGEDGERGTDDDPADAEPSDAAGAAGETTTHPSHPGSMPDAGALSNGEAGAAGGPTSSSPEAGSPGQAGAAAGAGGAPDAPAAGTTSTTPPDGSLALALTTEPRDDAAYVFDQTQLRTYNIQVAAADLAMLDQNPSAEVWVPGTLELDGVVHGQVGVRYKGGYSGFQPPCSSGAGAPKSGKCSIKLAFDEYDDKGRLHGLKKLNLHSMNADPSMMHDRLGYALFREFGVAAPRAVHAVVYFNGVAQGLFIAVEQIDGRFTRARFADGGEGNVYKEIWPLYTDAAVYSHALETNETEAQVQGMLAFSESVKRGASDLGDFIDRDYTLRYLAVDRVVMNDDGAMHFWCSEVASGNSPTDIGNHNYYWYQEQTSLAQPGNKFWLLPWDLDMTFSFNHDAHIITPWYETSACNCMQSGDGYQIAASCDPLVQHFIPWKSDYDTLIDSFLAGPFSAAAVEAKLAAWSTQVDAAVAKFADTPSAHGVGAWQAGLEQLRHDIDGLRAHRGYAY